MDKSQMFNFCTVHSKRMRLKEKGKQNCRTEDDDLVFITLFTITFDFSDLWPKTSQP